MVRTTVLVLAALALTVHAPGCGWTGTPTLRGSGVKATSVRTLGEFTRVEADGALDLSIRAGESPGVEVDGDDNLVNLFETRVLGDTLRLALPPGSYAPVVPLVARVTLRRLESVEVSGAVHAGVVGLSGGDLRVELSGASSLTADGKVDALDAEARGACRLGARDVEARTVRLELDGACSAHVHATDRLVAEASGASTALYRGSPTVESSISGAARVRPE